LCKEISETNEDELIRCYAVFIYNDDHGVMLWEQRGHAENQHFVIWDYHVVLLYAGVKKTLICDFDTLLNFPCDASLYIERTLRPYLHVDTPYRRFFRVVNAAGYLQQFSSDRRHMLDFDGNPKEQAPSWPIIYNPGMRNFVIACRLLPYNVLSPDYGHNLADFIVVDNDFFTEISEIYDQDTFIKFVTEVLKPR
uniref:Protein N-terminal glutamine amidohydrolase n=1 Tax=Gongylonema pulchrum TaxID=637853 RepID=A0A183EM58_9BILA